MTATTRFPADRSQMDKLGSLLRTTSCMTAATALMTTTAYALPQGGQVVSGNVGFDQKGSTLTVNQGSDKAVINWGSFNIDKGETTHFAQPNANSVALNRVTGSQNPSQIMGTLSATGKVMLINPNGVMFGKGSRVDVAGLVASTADITDSDFLRGNYKFTKPGVDTAKIVNNGSITARQGGLVALVAPGVENNGVIQAKAGTVALGAGKTVAIDFYGDQLVNFAVDGAATSGIANNGSIAGHDVFLTADAASKLVDNVINNKGVVEATKVRDDNGTIVFDGGEGNVAVSGTVKAAGGDVAITGGNVQLASATVDVSGDQAGTIRVGGDKYGKGSLRHAVNTTIDKSSTLKADSSAGKGGDVVVWSDNATRFNGHISSKGTTGGFAEVSSKGDLGFDGTVNLTGANGKNGTLLLDPRDIVIGSGSRDNGQLSDGSVAAGDTGSKEDFVISSSAVEAALNNASVSMEAQRNINVNDTIDVRNDSAAKGNDLSLTAGNRINLKGDVMLNDGDLNLTSKDTVIDSTVELGKGRFVNNGTGIFRLGNSGSIRSDLVKANTDTVQINAKNIDLQGDIYAKDDLRIRGTDWVKQSASSDIEVDEDIRISGSDYVELNGKVVSTGKTDDGLIELTAGRQVEVTGTGYVEAMKGDVNVMGTPNALVFGTVKAGDDVNFANTTNVTVGNTGKVSADDDVNVTGGERAILAGSVNAGDDVTIDVSDRILQQNGSTVNSASDIIYRAGQDLELGGSTTAANDVFMTGRRFIDVKDTGFVRAGDDLRMRNARIVNIAGDVGAKNQLTLQASEKAVLSGLLSGTILSDNAGGDPALLSFAPVVDVLDNSIKLAQALKIVSTGGRVNLFAGTWNEGNVTIDRAVTVNGASKDATRINATGFNDGIRLVNGVDNVTLQNLTVENAKVSGIRIAASALSAFENLVFESIAVLNNGSVGIFAASGADTKDVTIANSWINGNKNEGIQFQSGSSIDGLTIDNNQINDNGRRGIQLEMYSNVTNGDQAAFADINIINNDLDGNGGKSIRIEGDQPISGVNIEGNTVSDFAQAGISVDGPIAATITNNTVTGGVDSVNGIEVFGNVSGSVSGNTVSNLTRANSVGLLVGGIDGGNFTATNNTISGGNGTAGTGIEVRDEGYTGTGNVIQDFLYGYQVSAANTTLTNETMDGNDTGVFIDGRLAQPRGDANGKVTMRDLVINNGRVGILLDGPNAFLTVNDTATATRFNNISENFFVLINDAMDNNTIDGSDMFFDGTRGNDLTFAASEDKTIDENDNPLVGDVCYKDDGCIATNPPVNPPVDPNPPVNPPVDPNPPVNPPVTPGQPNPPVTPGQPNPPFTFNRALNEFEESRISGFGEALWSYYGQTLGAGDANQYTTDPNLSMLDASGRPQAATGNLSAGQLGTLEPAAGGQAAAGANCLNGFLDEGYAEDYDAETCGVDDQAAAAGV